MTDTNEVERVFVSEQKVKCKSCGREYVCTPSDDYYNSTNTTDGLCFQCMMRKAFAKPAPTHVSENTADSICKKGQGSATCAFLVFSRGGFACSKGSDLEADIRSRIKNGQMLAVSDNCSGPPNFTPSA